MVSATVDCYVFFLFSSHIFELKISRNPCLCAPHRIEQSRLMLPINYEPYMLFFVGGEARMMGVTIERLVLVRGFEQIGGGGYGSKR